MLVWYDQLSVSIALIDYVCNCGIAHHIVFNMEVDTSWK